jgi:virulence-associated protein VagC
MFKAGLVLAGSAVAHEPFSESAKFERWSHFKDYGVPAVFGKDALNSAAIADGSCRMLGQEFDGFHFWHYPDRVARVLQALKDAPPTSNPSHFVLSTEEALSKACSDKQDQPSQTTYELDSLAGSVQNWYHALTAPSSDASWKGQFDPAYQPQQVALTAGFVCIAACDIHKGELSSNAMRTLASSYAGFSRRFNETLPWQAGNRVFSGAKSNNDLIKSTQPLLKICGCKEDSQATMQSTFCPQSLHAIYDDMHDGDKKEITISGTSLTIRPSGNKQSWLVKSQVDPKSCSALIDFNVPGKPNPPPVKLELTLWRSSSSNGKKTVLEFTDPSGKLAAKAFPLNHWVQEAKGDVASFECTKSLKAIYADMHDGDKKEITIDGTALTIKPSGNNQTWVVKSEVDTKSSTASINFNVPGKPGPPPVNLRATLMSISSTKDTKTEFEFTDPTGTLASPSTPLNQWVEISKVRPAHDIVV